MKIGFEEALVCGVVLLILLLLAINKIFLYC